jgi:hypothetical protein
MGLPFSDFSENLEPGATRSVNGDAVSPTFYSVPGAIFELTLCLMFSKPTPIGYSQEMPRDLQLLEHESVK